jgi:hypothetical protein
MKASKYLLCFLSFIIFITCNSHDEEALVCGAECKIWILYDEQIRSSFQTGHTPFVFCFNNNFYQTYLVTGNGSLKRRKQGHIKNDFLDGNKWSIFNDSLRINNTSIHLTKVSEDTIKIRGDAMLINITSQFYIKNCNCTDLTGQFRGGGIDSIKHILNFKEKKDKL